MYGCHKDRKWSDYCKYYKIYFLCPGCYMQSIYEGQKLKDKEPWMQLKSACTSEQLYMIKMSLFNKKRDFFQKKNYLSHAAVGCRQRHLVLTDVNAPSSIACCQSLILLLYSLKSVPPGVCLCVCERER